jgi:transporter family protein
MSWLAYALLTVALWTGWSFLGKLALDRATPVQATSVFGIASVAAGAIALAAGQRATSWAPDALWLTAVSAACGGAGLVTFYLALDRGQASLVAPMIGLYPALVAVLSVAFLSERLSAVQVTGVLLAVTGVVLIGAGG